MPIYAYKCESCGLAKDVLQKISEAPLTDCPACGAPAFKKQLTAAGFQLKGSGWYATDFKGGSAPASGDAAPARCLVSARGVRILDARVSSEGVAAGEVRVRSGRVYLGCSQGSLEVLEVKPDGKRAMPAAAWAAGLRDAKLWAALS